MESILTSTKKALLIAEEYEHFDAVLIMHINSVLSILTQLGVGPPEGFSVKDANTKWSEFIPDASRIESVKTYVHMRVQLIFDPPTSSAHLAAIKETLRELEWRLQVATDPVESESKEEIQNGE